MLDSRLPICIADIFKATTQPDVKVKVKEEPTVRAGMKREHDPEFYEILASAHVRKVVKAEKETEVIDLSDD